MLRKTNFSLYLPIISLILIAFALRVAYLEELVVNPDETRTVVRLADASLEKLVLKYWAANHNLQGLILRAAAAVSENVFFLRYVTSVVFGVLAIPALFWLTKIFTNRRTALVSTFFLSLSAYHLLNSQILRGYSLLVFMSILLTGILYRSLKTNSLKLWGIFSLLSALNIYNHLFAAFLVSSQGLMVAWFWWHRRAQVSRRVIVSAVLAFVAIGGLTAILYSPFLPQMSQVARTDSSWESDIRPFSQASLADFFEEYADTTFNRYLGVEEGPYLSLIFFGVVSIGLFHLFRKRPVPGGWLFIWIVAPYLQAIVLLNLIPGFYVGGRFLQYVVPPLLIALACGSLSGLPSLVRVLNSRGKHSKLVGWTSVLSIGLLFAVLNIRSNAERVHTLTRHNWSEAVRYLAQHAKPYDLILCERYEDGLNANLLQSPPRPENECTRNITIRARSQNKLSFVQPADIALDYEFLAQIPWQLLKEKRVWLVRWDIPENAPLYGGGYSVMGRNGRIDIVSTGELPLIEGLEQVANLLTTFDESSVSQAIHWGNLAQIQVSVGNTAAARASLERATALLARHPEYRTYQDVLQKVLKRPPLVQYPAKTGSWQFADHINLIGYSHQMLQREGNLALGITLFWKPTATPTGDYTIFVHLVGEDGTRLAQVDYRPFDGLYPTSWWLSGDVIWETRYLDLPEEIPSQNYTLWVGMYNLETLERLPVLDENAVDSAIPLFTLDSHTLH